MAKRGRKTIDNKEILAQLLEDPEQREELKKSIDKLIELFTLEAAAKDAVKNAAASISDETGLSKGFVKKLGIVVQAKSGEALVEEAVELKQLADAIMEEDEEF